MTAQSSRAAVDVLVIGDGLVGLACAAAAAERGFVVQLVGQARPGAASLAAAGMLAPSIERSDGPASAFAIAARDRYPAYVDWLRDRSGVDIALNRDGIIQVAVSEAGVRGLRRGMPPDAEWLDATELRDLEPALSHGLGGVFHANDGAIDNVSLYRALLSIVRSNRQITITDDLITELAFPSGVVGVGRSGTSYSADRAVLSAGAWSSTIRGLPRSLPVEPVRGQIIAFATAPVRRVVYGPTGYVVPRANGRTLVGSTAERAGFESVTTPEGVERLRRTAAEIIPRFAHVEPVHAWSGLRPMSADLQPILGADPDEPRLIYATGHSRNGVLMAPITADCVAALLLGDTPDVRIGQFSVDRFATVMGAHLGQPSTHD